MRWAMVLVLASCATGAGDADATGGADTGHSTPMRVAVHAVAFEPGGAAIWAGTSAGAWRVDLATGERRRWSTADGLASDTVVSVLAASDGAVWLAHGTATCAAGPCGITVLGRDGVAVVHAAGPSGGGLPDGRVVVVAEAPGGAIWAGTASGAAWRAGGAWVPWSDFHDCASPATSCEPLWSVRVSDIAFGPDGAAWLAIDQQQQGVSPKPGGVASRRPDGRTDTWDTDDGLPSNAVRAVAVSGDAVFAGTDAGVARLSQAGTRFEYVSATPAVALAADGQGGVWAASPAGALRLGPDGTTQAVGQADGLPSGDVKAVAVHGQLVCFGTAAGLACLDQASAAWSWPL